MPTAADRQLRRECEQALRSDSSSVDAQLGALAAHPLAVEMAHVGEQGRRVRRFWLPRGLSASVEELEVEVGCQVNTARPAASANWLSGGLLQHRSTLQARSLPRASASLGQSARHRGRGFDVYRRASPKVAASIAYGCSLHRLRLQPPSLTVAGGQPRALRVGGERRAEHLPGDRRPGERARQACARARLPSCNRK